MKDKECVYPCECGHSCILMGEVFRLTGFTLFHSDHETPRTNEREHAMPCFFAASFNYLRIVYLISEFFQVPFFSSFCLITLESNNFMR